MKPILFAWGPVIIPSFGFFLAFGFLIGSFVLWRRLKDDYPEEDLLTLSLVLGLWSLLISRIFHVLANFDKFGLSIWSWLSLTSHPGLSLYGAIVGLVIGCIFFVSRAKWRLGDVWDGVTEGGLWVFLYTSVGAYLSSIFPGKKTSLPWGIEFSGIEGKRHPISIYIFIIILLILFITWWLRISYRKFRWYRSGKVGFVGLSVTFLLGLSFLILENFIDRGIYFYEIKLESLASILIVASSLIIIYLQSGRKLFEDQNKIGKYIRSRIVVFKQKSRTNKGK